MAFEAEARAGATALRAGDASEAAHVLRDALARWRGAALGELTGTHRFAADAADRLDALRVGATADRIEADLRLGGGADLLPELDRLTADHPLHERLAAQRLRALAAAGRPAEALAAYEAVRVRLDAELGALPSAELRAAHLALVDGTADAPAPVAARGAAAPDDGPGPGAQPSPAPVPALGRRSTLRAPLTSFVGREDQIERLDALVAAHRLVTLVGPGGAGKTRLAGEVARRQEHAVADGVWMAELATVTAPGDVPASVLGALGLREARLLAHAAGPGAAASAATPESDPTEHLLDVLAERETVLVLDNCEHVIGAAAALADRLLAHCPRLRIVATSREPLGVPGERLEPVAPLGLPPAGADARTAAAYPAVRLFADRAAAASPGFAVDDATVGSVVEICRRLDGLPLALELAAARLRSLPVAQVAARLDDRFRLLTGGSRTALPRQQTLRAVVDWSWDLLSEEERLVARRIAVFPGGVTPESAAAVCAGDGRDALAVLDLLAALVDRSLLVLVDREAPRYRMLETIREYGLEQLTACGEDAATRTAHARFFAALAAEADAHLRGPEQLRWFRRLQPERDDLLAALRRLADEGDARSALALAVSLIWFWVLSGRPNEAVATVRLAHEVPGDADPVDRLLAESVLLLRGPVPVADVGPPLSAVLDRLDDLDLSRRPLAQAAAPVLAWFSSNPDRADRLFARARESRDPWVRATVPLGLGRVAENAGDVAGFRRHLEEALAAFRALGERWGLTTTLSALSGLMLLEDDLDGAAAALEEVQRVVRELGADGDDAHLRFDLADVRWRRGDLEGARDDAARALDATDVGGVEAAFATAFLARITGLLGDGDRARELIAAALETAGRAQVQRPERGHIQAAIRAQAALVALDGEDAAGARRHLAHAYPEALRSEDGPIIALVGVAVAGLAAAVGDAAGAAEILGAAARLRGAEDRTQPDVVRLTARLRTTLGEQAYAAAFAAGRERDRDDALRRLDPAGVSAA
nr:BTAD domain-containing putative transcriptional regulator [Patulibacter sp. SYSU D01012]